MYMDLALQITMYVLALLLLLAGLAGCVLPYPGHLLVLLGLACYAVGLGDADLGWWIWVFLTLLAVLGMLVDNITTLMGARCFGCSRAAVWMSLLGFLVGCFFFPVGLIVGPFLGALVAELLIARRDWKQSSISGLGAVLGVVAGVYAKFLIAVVMVIWFVIHVNVYGSGHDTLLWLPY